MTNTNPPTQKNFLTGNEIQAAGNVQIGDVHYYMVDGQRVGFPSALTNLVPAETEGIIGRNDEIKAIKTHFECSKRAVLVHGIGGMGKTTVARKFMVEQVGQYTHRAWLNAAAGLREAFINNINLLDSLQIRADVEGLVNNQRLEDAFGCVIKKLKDLKSVLVVLDNANSLEDLLENKKHFEAANCHFLITTRAEPQGWALVPITELPEPDAVAMFKNIHPDTDATDADLTGLVNQLFRHPLLIELMAKTVKANNLAFPKLRAAISEKFIHDPEINKRKVDVSQHSDETTDLIKRATIEEYIWRIFQNVTNLHDHAKGLLRAFSLLPTATAFDEDFLAAHFEQWDLATDMYDVLDIELGEGGWLTKEILDEKPAYKMHPLIAEVVVKHLEVVVEFADVHIKQVADLINYSNTNPEHDLFEKNKVRPLAERLCGLFFWENNKSLAYLLDRLGYLEENFGTYDKMVRFGERSLQIAMAICNENDSTISAYQNNLGWALQYLGHYDRAAELLETALTSDLKNYGDDHHNVAVCQSNLANVYGLLGRYDRAAALLETALASELKHYGPDHPRVALTQSNLANVYNFLGRYDHAAELLEKTLASDLNNFGNDHPTVARSQSNLAGVYHAMGRYDSATKLLETALAKTLNSFGDDHPTVAVFQSNLASVYGSSGCHDRAAELLELALANELKNFGKDHPSVAISQSNLGIVYLKLGNYDNASKLSELALTSDLKNFGENHPEVALKKNNLADVYQNMGRVADAKTLWKSAYENLLKNLGPEHPHTISCKKSAGM